LIDPTAPALALALVFMPTLLMRHFWSERRQRWMKQTFSRYVSPNLVEYLVANPDALELGGRRQRCSFVFTDLQGFTSLMESMDPTAAVEVLNGYLDRMIAIAFEHDGTLDRIVGDAVAIMFSAPIEQADHEQRALRCALQMQSFASDYVDALERRGIPFCQTRIGVHTGEVTVGNFGGAAIFDYRALGDPVNTAARLEGANKHLGTRICISDATLAGCPDARARPIGRIRLAGRASYLMVHEPLTSTSGQGDVDHDYQRAYELMRTGSEAALADFESLATRRPEDRLVALHLSRLRAGRRDDAIDISEK
jgi:adenylate cyclase